MLISIDWINDFVKTPDMDPQKLGEKFTLATAEVEGVVTSGEHLKNMCVAKVLEFEKHPEADKLNLVTFEISGGEKRKVVCGAPNVKVGMKTPFAPIGTVLPGGFELTPKKIRGVLSEGMLCSESELGLSEESQGIMELPSDAPVGQSLDIYFKETPDILLDIDNKSLTHRPDLWGHFGMAREFSAIFKNPLKNPYDEKWQKKLEEKIPGGNSPVKVKFDGDSAGIGYYGLTVKNVKVGESPAWMKSRLTAVGLRPINSIVDISNYVMMELGHPNHIFDRDLIDGDQVIIKRVGEDTTFVTLDEEERKLVPEDTVICDGKKALVIAGLMGGLNSGVNEKTSTVFLEVANWKAAQVRRTSTRLGLRTDSSQRYEKSLDSHLMKRTLFRLLDLITQLNPEAEVVGGLEYDGKKYWDDEPLVKPLTLDKINSVLGTELKSSEVKEILESLDFHVKGDDPFAITVPTYRATKDIEHPDDIIEEIGRIIGYDNISSSAPKWEMVPARLTEAQSLHRKIRDFMAYHGKSFEVMTYPLVGEKLYKNANWPLNDDHKLLNALSVDQEHMRPSLVPSLLEAAGKNVKQFDEFRFFELGRSYLKTKDNFQDERSQLGIVFYDQGKTPFVPLCNQVETLLQTTNIPGELVPTHPKFKNPLVSEDWEGTHPFEFLNIRVMGKMVGVILSIHPILLRKFKIKGHLSMALLDMTTFENNRLKNKTKYRPLPKFPGSKFDCTVVLEKDRPVGDVLAAMKKVKIKEMESFKILDVFPEGDNKSVTVRASFIDPEKTLSGEFITQAQKMIMDNLNKSGLPLKE